MAAVQRKLVHKQFNSPMGLYSQENVKATLDRELKAFGSDGIEIDDQIAKPLNLANSAVLRAVEEEEEMKCETGKSQRQSRPRKRFLHNQPHTPLHQQQLEQIKTQYLSHHHDITIDRDTVLKINRLATRRNLHKRDHSWPPGEPLAAEAAPGPGDFHMRSSSNDNVLHFDASVCKRHGIDAIREKFNSPTRIIEPTPREVQLHRRRQQLQQPKQAHKSTRQSIPMTNACNNKDNTSSAIDSTAVDGTGESPYAAVHTPTAKGFSAPETKAADEDIGLVAPKRQYYEQLATGVTKRCQSCSTAVINNNNRQSHSLERGRARQRRQQLPPLKPRASSGGGTNVAAALSTSGDGGSWTASSSNLSKSPKLQRRSIKLATEIKICYDTDAKDHDAWRGAALKSPTSQRPQIEQINKRALNEHHHLNDSIIAGKQLADLEHIPLPPTPTAASTVGGASQTADKCCRKLVDITAVTGHQREADTDPKKVQHHKNGNLGQLPEMPQQQTRIVPVTVEQRNEENIDEFTQNIPSDQKDPNAFKAQQIYDDACIYLRSIDLQDNTAAYIPAAITIVPSPTEDMLQRWGEPSHLKAEPKEATNENLMHAFQDGHKASSIEHAAYPQGESPTSTDLCGEAPTYVTRLPATPNGIQLTRQTSLVGSKRRPMPNTPQTPQPSDLTTPLGRVNNKENSKSYEDRENASEKRARRQGIYYTDGEYLYGPYNGGAGIATTKLPVPIEIKNDDKMDCDQSTLKEAAAGEAQSSQIEIAALEAKYGQIQQSIADHLRQIDEYMANAKMALNRSLERQSGAAESAHTTHIRPKPNSIPIPADDTDAGVDGEILAHLLAAARHSPVVVVESPLQVVLRQICRKTSLSPQNQKAPAVDKQGGEHYESTCCAAIKSDPVENMPIVEQALLDLSNIAASILDCQPARRTTGELLAVSHTVAPTASQPLSITIDEHETDDENTANNLDDSRSTPFTVSSLSYETNKQHPQSATQITDESATRLEHVAEVVANYEQLSATTRKQSTEQQEDDVGKSVPPKPGAAVPLREAGIETAMSAPKDDSKNVVSDFIASRQSQEHIVEQVIDILDAQSNQAPAVVANLNQAQMQCQQDPSDPHQQQAQKQSATYTEREEDAAVFPQTQKNIISGPTNAASGNGAATTTSHGTHTTNNPVRTNKVDDNVADVADRKPHYGSSADPAACCSVCAACSKRTWSKLTLADQWRLENLPLPKNGKLHSNDIFDTYQATYEVRSPYISRQISWEETLDVTEQEPTQRSEVQIAHAVKTPSPKSDELERTANAVTQRQEVPRAINEQPEMQSMQQPQLPSEKSGDMDAPPPPPPPPPPPLPATFRRYPAPLIEPSAPPPRAVSPYGLYASTEAKTAAPAHGKHTYVPQVEGHNIGLLVRTATEPTQPPHSAATVTDSNETVGSGNDGVDLDDNELQRHFNRIAFSASPMASEDQAPATLLRARNHKSPEIAEKIGSAHALQHYCLPAAAKATTAMTGSRSSASPLSIPVPAGDLTHNSSTRERHDFEAIAQQQHELEPEFELLPVTSSTQSAVSREGSVINRSFDNVSPRPYITIEGYKRVAWPPVSEERIIREFTPQPQTQLSPTPAQAPAQHQQAQHQQQHQPTAPAAAPPQGPIYNNVRQNSPYPQQHPQHAQPQQHLPPQQQYQQPYQQQSQPQQQQPIQYTQAHFDRQGSREPVQPVNAPYQPQGPPQQQPYQQPQQQQQYQQSPQHQQHQPNFPHTAGRDGTAATSGWKPIRAPLTKPEYQYQCPGQSGPNSPQYNPHQQNQQPQFRASSYDNYQHQQPPPSQPQYQPQQQQPNQYQAPPQNQYQYQQPPPQQVPQHPPHWAQQRAPPQQHQQQHQAPPQQQYQAPSNYQHQAPPPEPQYQYEPQANQYNSYSQPQQQYHPVSQDQTDYQQPPQQQYQSLPQDYRGGSPGIIQLRKETPVTQKPAPVYTSQPAAVSFQGGSNMRGDLKWPPPEYKEAAAKENQERRALAAGPVCRPRKVHRDYTSFFAKNALNNGYASYKVPPGTQHMI